MSERSSRFLVVTAKPVYPVVGGAPLRNWQTINLLKQFGDVATFSIVSPKSNWSSEPPGISEWELHTLGPATAMQRKWRRFWWLRPQGHEWADQFYRRDLREALERFVDRIRPDVVVLEELWLHYYLPIFTARGIPVVYDAHNVESTLAQQLDGSPGSGMATLLRERERANIARIERHVVARSSQIWACSSEDQAVLAQIKGCPGIPVVVPNGINVRNYDDLRALQAPSEKEPLTLVFPGTFSYEPNAAAADELIERILPLVKQTIPDARLVLVGYRPTQAMQDAAAANDSIVVTGRVERVEPYLEEAHIMVVPLRAGGGTRLKILEAFAAGRPVVSTPKGAEGIRATDGEELILQNTPEELAASVVELSRDWKRATTLAQKARELAEREYSWEAIGPRVRQAVEAMVDNRPATKGQ